MSGWGCSKYEVFDARRPCAYDDCRRMTSHWCPYITGTKMVCNKHKSPCCKPYRLRKPRRTSEPTQTPLMELGTVAWQGICRGLDVEHHLNTAPVDLLIRACAHVERRIGMCKNNARGRATANWLGRWARRIADELARRNHATV